MKQELSERKHPRLDYYDYSKPGTYFVTVCAKNRRCVFSKVVGRGLAPAEIEKTEYGIIAEKQLLALEGRYPFVRIDRHVVMPNHIHAIIVITEDAAGVNPRPTLMDVICAYKSMTVRECRRMGHIGELFQVSFFEHIIRDRDDYVAHVRYILENPGKWCADETSE